MAKVELTADAQAGIDEAINYITLTLGSERAGADLTKAFKEFIGNVSEFPRMYSPALDETLKDVGFRCASVKSYVAIYRYDENLDKVTIYGFFHHSQNYAKLLI